MKLHEHDAFLSPQCLPTTVDLFVVRRAILHALKEQLSRFHGTVLDVGCGNMPYKPLLLAAPSQAERYIGLDIRGPIYQKPDLYWDGVHIPLPEESMDCALATEVLEHCLEPWRLLQETLRILKTGGFLFFTVPFLWPLHDVPYDHYRYTPFSLRRHLHDAGFGEIQLRALGGWDASFAQLLGLWVRRRPMSPVVRRWLSRLVVPLVRFLNHRDHPPQAFAESSMITGLAGVAFKPKTEGRLC